MTSETNQAFGSPEDEDLFDFPVSPAYSSEFSESADSTEVEAGADAQTDSAPDAASTQPAPAPAQPASPSRAQAEDFDLDEDLFDFGTLFDATQPLSTEEDALALEALDAQAAQEAAAKQAARAPKKQAAPKAQPAAKTHAPETATATAAPAAAAASYDPIAAGMVPPPSMDWSPEPKRGRLLEVLALSFLVLNTALVLLAWRAGSNFRETLAAVTRTVSDSVAEGHARGQLEYQNQRPAPRQDVEQSSLPIEPEVTSTQVETTQPAGVQTEKPKLPPSDVLDMPKASLELAKERIAKGQYSEARRGLFRLLANRDRTALTDDLIVQAEVLIAEAFAAQAREVK